MTPKIWKQMKQRLEESRHFHKFLTGEDVVYQRVFKIIEKLECEHECWAYGKSVEEIRSYYDALRTIQEVGKMGLQVGDKVKVNFDAAIKKATEGKKKERKQQAIIDLWEALNGRVGTVSEVVSDDEIWVKGDGLGLERMFNKHVLEKIDDE